MSIDIQQLTPLHDEVCSHLLYHTTLPHNARDTRAAYASEVMTGYARV